MKLFALSAVLFAFSSNAQLIAPTIGAMLGGQPNFGPQPAIVPQIPPSFAQPFAVPNPSAYSAWGAGYGYTSGYGYPNQYGYPNPYDPYGNAGQFGYGYPGQYGSTYAGQNTANSNWHRCAKGYDENTGACYQSCSPGYERVPGIPTLCRRKDYQCPPGYDRLATTCYNGLKAHSIPITEDRAAGTPGDYWYVDQAP